MVGRRRRRYVVARYVPALTVDVDDVVVAVFVRWCGGRSRIGCDVVAAAADVVRRDDAEVCGGCYCAFATIHSVGNPADVDDDVDEERSDESLVLPGESAVNLLQPGDFCGAAAEVKLLTMRRLAAMNDCGRVPRATFASSEGIRRYRIRHADSNDRKFACK